jgi:hypothetical protein
VHEVDAEEVDDGVLGVISGALQTPVPLVNETTEFRVVAAAAWCASCLFIA